VHREGLRVGERLDGDIDFRIGTEIAPSMMKIGTFKQCGVRERFLVAFKEVPTRV